MYRPSQSSTDSPSQLSQAASTYSQEGSSNDGIQNERDLFGALVEEIDVLKIKSLELYDKLKSKNISESIENDSSSGQYIDILSEKLSFINHLTKTVSSSSPIGNLKGKFDAYREFASALQQRFDEGTAIGQQLQEEINTLTAKNKELDKQIQTFSNLLQNAEEEPAASQQLNKQLKETREDMNTVLASLYPEEIVTEMNNVMLGNCYRRLTAVLSPPERVPSNNSTDMGEAVSDEMPSLNLPQRRVEVRRCRGVIYNSSSTSEDEPAHLRRRVNSGFVPIVRAVPNARPSCLCPHPPPTVIHTHPLAAVPMANLPPPPPVQHVNTPSAATMMLEGAGFMGRSNAERDGDRVMLTQQYSRTISNAYWENKENEEAQYVDIPPKSLHNKALLCLIKANVIVRHPKNPLMWRLLSED